MSLIGLALVAGLATPSPYGPPEVRSWVVRPDARTVSVRVSPVPKATVPTGPVPFTLEPWVLAVPSPPAFLAERKVLGTSLSLDLDGDGTLKGRWPLRCEAGVLHIGPWVVAPAGQQVRHYPAELPRLGPQGGVALLHSPCGPAGIVLGLAPPPGAVRITLPGPVLQVSLVERIDAKTAPRLQLAGFVVDAKDVLPPRVASVRASVVDPKPGWVHVTLALVPLPGPGVHTIDFRVVGAGSATISATVATAPGPDLRILSPATGQPLAE